MDEGKKKTIWDLIEINDLKSFQTHSEDYINKTNNPFRSITFYADDNPIYYFKENNIKNFEVEVNKKDDFWKVNLSRKIERKDYENGFRIVKGNFLLFKNDIENVWTSITSSGRDFYKLGLKRFLENFSPNISFAYLMTDEIRRIFESIDDEIKEKIIADKAIIYSHEKEGNISFEKVEYQIVFNEAKNQNKYVDKILFKIKLDDNIFKGYITRNGHTRYISGPSNLYYEFLIKKLAISISDKGKLFTNKSREFGSEKSKPLQIQFEGEAIKDVEDNLKIINSLKNIKRSSITVYHKNPYLHTSVLDFTDGSSADVFITSKSNISIIPSFKSTRNSLMKICNNITKEFREGKIIEGQGQKKDFNSYFI